MAKDWYVRVMGGVIGPIETAELRQMVAQRRLRPEDEVKRGAAGQWVHAIAVQGLFALPPLVPPQPVEQMAVGSLVQPHVHVIPPPLPTAIPHYAHAIVQPEVPTPAQHVPATQRLYLWLGIIGTLLTVVGIFAPVASGPVFSVNLFNNGRGNGVFLIIGSVFTIAAIVSDRYRYLWVTSAIHFWIVTHSLVSNARRLDRYSSIQLQWGWAVLYFGAFAMLAAVALRQSEPDAKVIVPPIWMAATIAILFCGLGIFTGI